MHGILSSSKDGFQPSQHLSTKSGASATGAPKFTSFASTPTSQVDLFFVFIFISRQAGLNTIQQLDVDAFFTNSHEALELLKPHAPHTEFMLLAAESPSSTAPRPVSTASTIVFVGNAIGISTKRDLATMLREAIPFGLTIYGYAWDLVPEFTPYWGGILPPEDLPRVYSSARVVLGATMDGQRRSGMINNRVFEVLAAGSILINDHYGALEALLGDHILYYTKPGDVTRHMRQLSAFPYSPFELQAFVRSAHTYDHRVRQVVASHTRLPTSQPCASRIHCPTFVVLLDKALMASNFLVALYVHDVIETALDNLRDVYRVQFATSVDVILQADLTFHDFVLALSCWQCEVDLSLRSKLPHTTVYGKGLYFLEPPSPATHVSLDYYDVLYFTNPFDDDTLSNVRTNRQHAFGLPSRPRPSARPIVSSCDWLVVGDWTDDRQRLVHILDHPTGRSSEEAAINHVVFPEHRRHTLTHTVAYLNASHPDLSVHFASTPTQVIHMLLDEFQCRALYLPSTDDAGGGDWVVGIAATLGLTLHVQPDTNRWSTMFNAVLNSGASWDIQYVADALRFGMTQRLCLGQGGASVRMVYQDERHSLLMESFCDILHLDMA
ncbi:hypothetical protein DYB25_000180 [Aphanomyces astaci]|uniref:Spore protein YkvP/CgeB glycosyl transferase-like domain-containing protein n=1 Tax=Aphanomyces astaci TaxID=112090 RepID=A0A397DEW5_APHAT|nr:hypothetical protein DYB25_000180 [Aphanomyces astaci]RHY60257.1 hypothetical protein DYB38_000215 [Aphanomyces astaci]RHY64778.1 hypothetical protein DYB30_000532 [Aphanomyces astaci]RHZ14839.1 hypothetical protein DYB26_005001 [Aphanomyces astaci]RHZ40910.1 hypothetical protein DYB31_001415 [Aphanomyces astaci]